MVDEQVADNDEPIIIVDKDKEKQYSDVSVMFKHDVYPKEEKANMEYLLYSYVDVMASRMLNERLRELAQEPDCPFDEAS